MYKEVKVVLKKLQKEIKKYANRNRKKIVVVATTSHKDQ